LILLQLPCHHVALLFHLEPGSLEDLSDEDRSLGDAVQLVIRRDDAG
jgi:hypothetical protein